MSMRRKLERMMSRTGLTAMGGPATVDDILPEAKVLSARVSAVIFQRQPMNPLAALLALDSVKASVARTVVEADVSELDREKFWDSYAQMEFAAQMGEPLALETQSKDLGLGLVRVTIAARLDKLPTEADGDELIRRQVEALRDFANALEGTPRISDRKEGT